MKGETKKQGKELAAALRQLAGIIEQMDDNHIAQFLGGRLSPVSIYSKSATLQANSKNGVRKKQGKIDAGKLQRAASELEAASNRQQGAEILDAYQLNKAELARMARLRNVHVTKDDNIARVREKLIESLIGARLGSLAIRGY